MTDINKALAFAKECLRYGAPCCVSRYHVQDAESIMRSFDTREVSEALEQFLANRFFIQINRGTSSLFKWSVIVGLQNRIEGPKGVFDHGHGTGDDMLDAIFDACVAAVRLYSNA